MIPRGFAVPQSGMARVKMYRWGNYGNRRPDKKQYSQYSQYSQQAPPAAAIQNLSAKNICLACPMGLPFSESQKPFFKDTQGICVLKNSKTLASPPSPAEKRGDENFFNTKKAGTRPYFSGKSMQ